MNSRILNKGQNLILFIRTYFYNYLYVTLSNILYVIYSIFFIIIFYNNDLFELIEVTVLRNVWLLPPKLATEHTTANIVLLLQPR